MKDFARLFRAIDQTTKTNAKIAALAEFFQTANDQDKLWAIALFSHKRPRRTVNTSLIREWAAEVAGLPLWLFEESYHIVGDLAETIALVTPPPGKTSSKGLSTYIEEIKNLKDEEEGIKRNYITEAWNSLDTDERFLFNKLITGGFRIGISKKSVIKGLAKAIDLDEKLIAHRLMGDWNPSEISFDQLLFSENDADTISRPYPFYLAYALEDGPQNLGDIKEWVAEWKWDGIRGQIINRKNQLFVWSRGEELVTDKFPEFEGLTKLPETDYVIDGEIICYRDGEVLPFNILQSRIGRKNVAKKHLQEAPVVMIVYDLLEWQGKDIRQQSILHRRKLLQKLTSELCKSGVILLSDIVSAKNWEELVQKRENARNRRAEGLMLKRLDSSYQVGRKKGGWWKWKIDPMTIDAVMIYAQRGHGRRANLYTDFTFAVWNEEGMLVPFTKAYSGLTDSEFNAISRWVRNNTLERFGPVCSVKPELVFELAFEGIAKSKRHKSGVALRFPRIKVWRKDKTIKEANTLEDLKALLSSNPGK